MSRPSIILAMPETAITPDAFVNQTRNLEIRLEGISQTAAAVASANNLSKKDQVFWDYQAADFVKDEWHQGKNNAPGSVDTAWVGYKSKNRIRGFLSAGQMAADIGVLNPEAAKTYRQDALLSLGKMYVDYCTDSKYKAETAESFINNFREVAGVKQADEALVTAWFSKALKYKVRDTIIGGLEQPQSTIVKRDLKSFDNIKQFNLLGNFELVDRSLESAIRHEVQRRGIGTDREQMNHLFWELMGQSVTVPGAYTILMTPALPYVWIGNEVVKTLKTTPEVFYQHPIIDSILFGYILLRIGLWPIVAEKKLGKYRKDLFTNIGKFAKIYRKYLNTGKAPGTPQLSTPKRV